MMQGYGFPFSGNGRVRMDMAEHAWGWVGRRALDRVPVLSVSSLLSERKRFYKKAAVYEQDCGEWVHG